MFECSLIISSHLVTFLWFNLIKLKDVAFGKWFFSLSWRFRFFKKFERTSKAMQKLALEDALRRPLKLMRSGSRPPHVSHSKYLTTHGSKHVMPRHSQWGPSKRPGPFDETKWREKTGGNEHHGSSGVQQTRTFWTSTKALNRTSMWSLI